MSKFYSAVLSNGTKMIINLKNVSKIYLGKNNFKTLTFVMAHEKNLISGGSLWFSGGDNTQYEITHSTEESALKEFEKIEKLLKS
jgi:hypothetical protein